MSQLYCAQCGGPLDARSAAPGSVIACPRCGMHNSVPQVNSPASVPAPPPPPPPRKGAGGFTSFMAFLALLGAATAIGLHYYDHDTPGKGMSAYDFATPEGAVRANIAMRTNGDQRAYNEYMYALTQARNADPDRTRKRDTLSVDHTTLVDGGKYAVVFYTYRDKDKNRYDTEFLEKLGKYYGADFSLRSAWAKESNNEKARALTEAQTWERRNNAP